jgi:NADP-dependent 3-hydroxy acid dehydrogenase YdfG
MRIFRLAGRFSPKRKTKEARVSDSVLILGATSAIARATAAAFAAPGESL